MANKPYDFVVFGASGFTGQFVVEEVARTIDNEAQGLRWAIAGRNMERLQTVVRNASKNTGKDLEEIPILIADVNVQESVDKLCGQARLVLNCVGPYALYGEAVVKSCVDHGTHHMDISGEPVFLEKMALLYNGRALEKGVYVIGACGWDSIPADMGVLFAKNMFQGDLNTLENYVKFHSGNLGMVVNHGTWDTVVHSVSSGRRLAEIRASLPKPKMPPFAHLIEKRRSVFHSRHIGDWCIPFLGSDKAVIRRTQAYLYKEKQERPVQFSAYMRTPSFLYLILFIPMVMMIGGLSYFSFGRCLLMKYPWFFSMGMFSKDGPTREQIAGTSFSHTMIGYGYSKKLPADEQHKDEPTEKIVVRVSGPEPGYVSTPICLVQSAYVLLSESNKLPAGGGVFSPGAAFAGTSLLERLMRHNIKFAVLTDSS